MYEAIITHYSCPRIPFGGVHVLNVALLFNKYTLYNTAICLCIPLGNSSSRTFIMYYSIFYRFLFHIVSRIMEMQFRCAKSTPFLEWQSDCFPKLPASYCGSCIDVVTTYLTFLFCRMYLYLPVSISMCSVCLYLFLKEIFKFYIQILCYRYVIQSSFLVLLCAIRVWFLILTKNSYLICLILPLQLSIMSITDE